MSAHIALPGIDPGQLRPGTVAPNILTGILRDSLDFHGLIVTDALNMAGVADLYGAEARRARLPRGRRPAASARRPARGDRRDGRARSTAARSRSERLDRRCAGCWSSSARIGLFTRRTVPLDSIPAVVGNAEFQADAARDRRAIDRDGEGFGGRRSTGSARARPPLTLVTYGEEENRTVGIALALELRARGFAVTLARLWPAERSARATIPSPRRSRGSPTAVFATADRPIARPRRDRPPRGAHRAHRPHGARAAHGARLARQSVRDRRPARGRLVPHRLALQRGRGAGRGAGARRRDDHHAAGCRSRFPPSYARGWGLQRQVDP